MSEFRKGCIGAFIGSGLYAAACNHGLIIEPVGTLGPMAFAGAYSFVLAVALFGRRAA